ncbi:hypothetical protein RHMOL_Rhmol05G0231900 [Rhododendron molle]|uniref:Uncharacterized protein n=1 Tax=Rhododendron molle TaxID=49168 RepID=A0ACC0NSJ6_RHOML|nr:hypothetical protein RHMOL_Rhmol05G0231900 [Rhododendron molle]
MTGETPAIETPLGLYLNFESTLQAEEVEINEMNKKIEELQREIDDERALKEKEMEKNKELVKQIEDIQRTNETLLVVINCNNEIAKQNDEERAARDKEEKQKSEEKIGVLLKENASLQRENEAATCRIRELVEQIDKERALKEKEIEKNKENAGLQRENESATSRIRGLVEQIDKERALKEKEIEKNKENAALQRENESATSRIRELLEQVDEERALKEKEIEKNKELVKQMEELKCEVVKQEEENGAKIAELEKQKAVMNKENAALVIQINEERALKNNEVNRLNSIIQKRDEEIKNITFKIHTKELDDLTKAQIALKKSKREHGAEILLKDEKIKMLEDLVSKQQMAAPVASEPQMAAFVGSEPRINALQNIDSQEDCVVDEIASEKDAQVEKMMKEIKENYPDAEVLENAVHRMNKISQEANKKAAELNVQSFKTYKPPVAKQQTNDEHKEHSDVIDFIPEQYRYMITTILDDESRLRVWAAEEVDSFVFDDDFRVLMLDEALMSASTKLKNDRTVVLKDGLTAVVECTFIHFPLVYDEHWTLLVLNTLNGKWDFYNSIASLNKKHAERARLLANQIAKDINLLTGTARMTNKVRIVPNAPQQLPASADCGVIVCYLMDRISRNKKINPKLSKEQCKGFRAKMAVKLLTDRPRSRSPEDNEQDDFETIVES